jgi:NADPH:quinone reductase-like Zn-dependent oxidoreductase
MKAVVRTEYGPPDVVRIEDVAKPVPGDSEVLIRVVAASINGSDREGLAGKPVYARIGGLTKPRHRILGSDIAGRVEEVGKRIVNLRPGDEVLGEVPGYHSGFAEYVCAPETTFVRKPAGLTFEEAAAIPQAGAIALQGIRIKGQVRPGQKVLVNGAGGAAGSFAVQLAKLHGAEVTGVDHGDKEQFLVSLGADHVIDFARGLHEAHSAVRPGSRHDCTAFSVRLRAHIRARWYVLLCWRGHESAVRCPPVGPTDAANYW